MVLFAQTGFAMQNNVDTLRDLAGKAFSVADGPYCSPDRCTGAAPRLLVTDTHVARQGCFTF